MDGRALSDCLNSRQCWQGPLPCAGRYVLPCCCWSHCTYRLCFQCYAEHPKALGWLEAFVPVLVVLPGSVVSDLEMWIDHFDTVLLPIALPLLTKSYLTLPFSPAIFFYRETTHLLQGLSCQVPLTPTCHLSKPHLTITAHTHKQGLGQRTRRVSNSSSLLLPTQMGQPLMRLHLLGDSQVGNRSIQTMPVPRFLGRKLLR